MLFWRKQQRPPKANIDEALSRALRFTEADLEVNRSGQLTEGQASQIRLIDILNLEGGAMIISAKSEQAWHGASLVLAGFSCLVIIGSLIDIVTTQSFEVAGSLILFAVIIVQIPIFNTLHYRKCRNALATDLEVKRVASVEGKIFLDTSHNRWTNRRKIRVQDSILFLPNETCFHTFKNLRPYQLFYLPHTKLVVSADPMFET